MNQDEQRSLNHFACYRFASAYWQLEADERTAVHNQTLSRLREASQSLFVYSTFPAGTEADLLLWTAITLEDDHSTADFFDGYVRAMNPLRRYLQPTSALWGYTAPSTYSKARSAQEMDPFTDQRQRYLVAYPFVKTSEWYLLSRDARQGMMNEHIRLGKQYPQIKQLLLYSFGLQNQEFVVVYETEDLPLFSKLVQELRATDARPFTLRDTPLLSAIRQTGDDPFLLWNEH